MFNHSEVIMLTNKSANKQTNRRRWKHRPRFARLHRWINNNNNNNNNNNTRLNL